MKLDEYPLYGYIGPFEQGRIKSVRTTGKRVELDVRCLRMDYTVVFTEVYAVHQNRAHNMDFSGLAEFENSGPGRYFEFTNEREGDDALFAIEAENVKFKGRTGFGRPSSRGPSGPP